MGTSLNNLPLHKAYAGAAEVSNIYSGPNLVWTNTLIVEELSLVGSNETVAMYGGIDTDGEYLFMGAKSSTSTNRGAVKFLLSTLEKVGQYQTSSSANGISVHSNYIGVSEYYNIRKLNKSTLQHLQVNSKRDAMSFITGTGSLYDTMVFRYYYSSHYGYRWDLRYGETTGTYLGALVRNIKRYPYYTQGWMNAGDDTIGLRVYDGDILMRTMPVVTGGIPADVAATPTHIFEARGTSNTGVLSVHMFETTNNTLVKTINFNFTNLVSYLAKIVVVGDYLYVVSYNELVKYDLINDVVVKSVTIKDTADAEVYMVNTGDYLYISTSGGTPTLLKYTL